MSLQKPAQLVKITAIICLFLMLPYFFNVPAYASPSKTTDKTKEERFYEDINVIDGKPDFTKKSLDCVIVGKTVISKEVNLGHKDIYIRKGSCLIVKKGAKFSPKRVVVEAGGNLYITNGNLYCEDLYNFGRITIRENGGLKVSNSFTSNGNSSINLKGNMFLGKMDISDVASQIKAYDPKFNLTDYCIRYAKLIDTIYFNYCIGEIVTDYFYKYKENSSDGILKKLYNTKVVYDKELRARLLKAVNDYKLKKKPDNYDDIFFFKVDIRFKYSFSSKELDYDALFEEYSPVSEEDIITDDDEPYEIYPDFKEDKVGIVA